MWSINKGMKIENRRIMNQGGFSLVEVLVAITVGAVMMTMLGSLIFAGLRFFGSGNANAEVQNESQRVMNLTLDVIMETQGLCTSIPALNGNTDCLLLGEFKVEPDPANIGQYRVLFKGNVVAYRGTSLYLIDRLQAIDGSEAIDGYTVLATGQDELGAAAQSAFNETVETIDTWIDNTDDRERLPWLMGSYVSRFRVSPDVSQFTVRADGSLPLIGGPGDFSVALPKEVITYLTDSETRYYFYEPFTLKVDIDFAYPYNQRTVDRKLTDSVTVRSNLKNIYLEIQAGAEGGSGALSGRGMTEYRRR